MQALGLNRARTMIPTTPRSRLKVHSFLPWTLNSVIAALVTCSLWVGLILDEPVATVPTVACTKLPTGPLRDLSVDRLLDFGSLGCRKPVLDDPSRSDLHIILQRSATKSALVVYKGPASRKYLASSCIRAIKTRKRVLEDIAVPPAFLHTSVLVYSHSRKGDDVGGVTLTLP